MESHRPQRRRGRTKAARALWQRRSLARTEAPPSLAGVTASLKSTAAGAPPQMASCGVCPAGRLRQPLLIQNARTHWSCLRANRPATRWCLLGQAARELCSCTGLDQPTMVRLSLGSQARAWSRHLSAQHSYWARSFRPPRSCEGPSTRGRAGRRCLGHLADLEGRVLAAQGRQRSRSAEERQAG